MSAVLDAAAGWAEPLAGASVENLSTDVCGAVGAAMRRVWRTVAGPIEGSAVSDGDA